MSLVNGIKTFIKGTGAFIKGAGMVKAKIDALQDDTDLDGVPEYVEIQAKAVEVKDKALALWIPTKELAALCWNLGMHFWQAGQKQEQEK